MMNQDYNQSKYKKHCSTEQAKAIRERTEGVMYQLDLKEWIACLNALLVKIATKEITRDQRNLSNRAFVTPFPFSRHSSFSTLT
jgi:hypothetical protein